MRRLPRQCPVEVRANSPAFPDPCSPARLNSTAGLCQAAARRVPGAAIGSAAAPAARGRADQVPAQGGQAGDAAQEGDEEEEAEGQEVSQGPVVLESGLNRTLHPHSLDVEPSVGPSVCTGDRGLACGDRVRGSNPPLLGDAGCTGIGDRLDQAGMQPVAWAGGRQPEGGGSVGHYLELLGNHRTSTEDRGRDR